MPEHYELLAGDKSHGVFPTREAAKSFAATRDRVNGVEVRWEEQLEDAIGYRSTGTAEWRVTPARSSEAVR